MATRKWGTETLVNTTLAGNQLHSGIAGLADGGYVIVWEDDSGSFARIMAQRFDAQGNALGGEVTVSAAPGNSEVNPAVTALKSGGFLVNWTQPSGTANYMFGSVYDANGNYVRDQTVAFPFGLDNNADNASLDQSGGSVVVWEGAANAGDISMRYFDVNGAGGSVLTANSVTSGAQFAPSVASSPSDSVLIAWSNSTTDIKARIFNSDGSEWIPEFTIASNGGAGSVADVQVTWLADGLFAASWTRSLSNDTNIYVKIFDDINITKTITARSGDILVNTIALGAQTSSQIIALPTGGFAIAWKDASHIGGDPSGAGIKLQAFDMAGDKVGGEFLVNTTVTGNQDEPQISALSDGRIVVSWSDFGSGDFDIKTQIIDPRDGVVIGTAAADTLYGQDGAADEINGYDGADSLFGLAGNDVLYGGAGADIANGGRGDDTAYGGADADDLRGNGGDDALYGEGGSDSLKGGKGDDELYGGAGSDTMAGNEGADVLNGGVGTDQADYSAAASAVTVSLDGGLAGTGDAAGDSFIAMESLGGTVFNDLLRGNSGVNGLSGRLGDDRLEGMAGADGLTGGQGNDTFAYNALNEGGDTITDFGNVAGNDDRFAFKGSAFSHAVAPLNAGEWQSDVSSTALTPGVRFFYETDTGILRYDADGIGASAAAVVIATLSMVGGVFPTLAIDDITFF